MDNEPPVRSPLFFSRIDRWKLALDPSLTFDPSLLVRANGSDEAKVAAAVAEMLDALGPQKLIANLREVRHAACMPF